MTEPPKRGQVQPATVQVETSDEAIDLRAWARNYVRLLFEVDAKKMASEEETKPPASGSLKDL